ncbi:MAG TPA: hypothetical protein VK168_14575 [Saprospiraceae bacterium]|nr:hypothetical protein [Saprospiraceae bacterium]
MTKTTLCLLAFFGAVSLSAQNKMWEVSGIIRSDLSISVPGVSILINDTLRTTTDAFGFFLVRLPTRPRTLTAKRIGYEQLKVKLRDYPFKDRATYLELELQSTITVLPEFTVSAKSVERIFQEDYQHDLVDFELIGKDQILLLSRNKNRYTLQLTADDGTILDQIDLPGKTVYQQIYKGCLSTYHVPGLDWAFELRVNDNKLDTLGKYPAVEFDAYILPCAAMVNGCFFFEHRLYNGNAVEFEWMDPSGMYHPLLNVYDEETFSWLQRNVRDFYRKNRFEDREAYFEAMERRQEELSMSRVPPSPDPSDVEPVKRPGVARVKRDIMQQTMRSAFRGQLLPIVPLALDSIYVPMFVIGDSIFVLNHKQNLLLRLEPDSTHGRVFEAFQSPLTYHKERGWRKFALVDSHTHRAYGVFRKYINGLTLKEINFETGAAGKSYVISEAPLLCKEYKLRNGILYFLGQPDPEIPNYALYKVDMFQFGQK